MVETLTCDSPGGLINLLEVGCDVIDDDVGARDGVCKRSLVFGLKQKMKLVSHVVEFNQSTIHSQWRQPTLG